MNAGVLLFAFNNSTVNYVNLAKWSAARISTHLDLPVSLVTDRSIDDDCFDHVIVCEDCRSANTRYYTDLQKSDQWHNKKRSSAYELSPYDWTIVLDVDYVVSGDQLALLLQDPRDFVCHTSAINVPGHTSNDVFGTYNMPMAWATVMRFNRSPRTELLFDLYQMVETNYSHYANIYGFDTRTYRNDYALSIALHLYSGQCVNCWNTEFSIPWSLLNVDPLCDVEIDQTRCEITYVDPNSTQRRKTIIKDADLHMLGKQQLEKHIASQ